MAQRWFTELRVGMGMAVRVWISQLRSRNHHEPAFGKRSQAINRKYSIIVVVVSPSKHCHGFSAAAV